MSLVALENEIENKKVIWSTIPKHSSASKASFLPAFEREHVVAMHDFGVAAVT